MKVRKHNVGELRWHISAWPNNWVEKREFEQWMKETCPDCFLSYRNNYGEEPYYEIRGTNHAQMMTIVLSWGFSG